ncbi:hypothetical protein PDK10_27500, partial [Bacillus cereus]|nr:hypothetical protein [Bacillus cereus]
ETKTEAGFVFRRRIGVAGDIQDRAIGGHGHAADVVRPQGMLAAQGQRGVDGGERMAAADVVLEGEPGDVEVAAQRRTDV